MIKKQKQNIISWNHSKKQEQNLPKELSSKRLKSDVFFMICCIFVGLYEIYVFIQFPDVVRVLETYGIRFNSYELLWLIPGYLFSYSLYSPIGKTFDPYWSGVLVSEGSREGESHEKRIKRLRTYLMATIYYATSFVFTTLVALQEGYLPRVFGGTLDLKMEQNRWPKPAGNFVKILYLFEYGHHLERLFNHIYNDSNSPTFYTMLLHHIVTVGMIAVSYQNELKYYGIAVLILCDFGDTFLQASRFLRETQYKNSAKICFVIMAVNWLQGRIIGLGWEVIPAVFDFVFSRHSFVLRFFGMHFSYILMICTLWILNVFWFFQIVKIFISIFLKNKMKFDYEDSRPNQKKIE